MAAAAILFLLCYISISPPNIAVDFLCRLFGITFVHAVIGADGRRYVLVTEQLLNDFRVFLHLKAYDALINRF